MLKLTVAVLTVALASTASAGGWRSLRIDASDADSFSKSVKEFQQNLSPAHRYVFEHALQDIWIKGAKDAEAEQHEYTAADYYAQLDGLRYKDVVKLTDPTGRTATMRYREAYALLARPIVSAPGAASGLSPWPQQTGHTGFNGEQVHGIDNQRLAIQERLMDKGRL